MRVLVAFASKHGATGEIAEAIAAALRERGIEADVESVDAVIELDAYDAIVLGSAVYMGHWLDAAQAFRQVARGATHGEAQLALLERCHW